MKIKTWLRENHVTQTILAEILDIGRPHLCNIISGKMTASRKLARNMAKATDGAITAASLMDKSACGDEKKPRTVNRFSLL